MYVPQRSERVGRNFFFLLMQVLFAWTENKPAHLYDIYIPHVVCGAPSFTHTRMMSNCIY